MAVPSSISRNSVEMNNVLARKRLGPDVTKTACFFPLKGSALSNTIKWCKWVYVVNSVGQLVEMVFRPSPTLSYRFISFSFS